MTLWTVGHQAPLSMRFPRQECWGGLPFSPPGDLPSPGIELASPALADGFFFFFQITEHQGSPILYVVWCGGLVSKSWLNFATPWTVARQAPLSMVFSMQECWSGLPFSSLGIFPTQGLNTSLLHCGQIFFLILTTESPGKPRGQRKVIL